MKSDDCRCGYWFFVILSIVYDIIYAGDDVVVNLFEDSGCSVGGEVGRGGDDRFAEAFEKVSAKFFLWDADRNAAVFMNEIVSEPDSTVVDDGGGFICLFEKIEYLGIGVGDIF